MRAVPRFQHEPLDHSVDSIRLIQILPDLSPCGRIRCRMHHTVIKNAIYTCLSYEWGTEGGGDCITINDELYRVRQNLLDFLEVARKIYFQTSLWIVALCIDQTNNSERSHQGNRMGTIYSQAPEVWTWLGQDSTTAKVLTDLDINLRKPQSIDGFYGGLHGSFIRGDWELVRGNSYSTWAWITQEIALARKIWLLAQDKQIDKGVLPYRLVHQIPVLRGLRDLNPKTDSLFALLHTFRKQQCKIKRDTVFSLLALCQIGTNIAVNYTLPDSEISGTY